MPTEMQWHRIIHGGFAGSVWNMMSEIVQNLLMLGSVDDQIIWKAHCDYLWKSQVCAIALPAGERFILRTISRESSIARRFVMLFFHEW